MNTLIEKASDIIRAASASQLGLYVFCIFVTAVLVVLLFRRAPLAVQIGAFVATLLLMAVIIVLALPLPHFGGAQCIAPIINPNGKLDRVVATKQCATGAWRPITSDSCLEIGLMGTSLGDARADIRVRQTVDGSPIESAENDVTSGVWTKFYQVPGRTLWIYISEISECWVKYDIKDTGK